MTLKRAVLNVEIQKMIQADVETLSQLSVAASRLLELAIRNGFKPDEITPQLYQDALYIVSLPDDRSPPL
jgi:hypothetical protein